MTREEFIENLEDEWTDLNDGSCQCSTCGHPPCHYCEGGGGSSLEDYIEWGLETSIFSTEKEKKDEENQAKEKADRIWEAHKRMF